MAKYCKELTAEIANHLQTGHGRVDACTLAGISYETFTQWMQKPEFIDAIKKAETICKDRNIKIIQKAAINTWQAAAWWLERKYKDEFAIRTHVDHSVGDRGRFVMILESDNGQKTKNTKGNSIETTAQRPRFQIDKASV